MLWQPAKSNMTVLYWRTSGTNYIFDFHTYNVTPATPQFRLTPVTIYQVKCDIFTKEGAHSEAWLTIFQIEELRREGLEVFTIGHIKPKITTVNLDSGT